MSVIEMGRADLTIVFKKLAEATAEQPSSQDIILESGAMRQEIEEIAELRKAVLEITEPEPKSYTTT